MFHYVYAVVNLLNEKIYVGKHSTNDLDDGYMGSGKLISFAIKKYGLENFRKFILEQFETEELALEYEKQIVNEQFVKSNETYNLTLGGYGSFFAVNENYSFDQRSKNGKLGAASLKKRLENDNELRKTFVDRLSNINKRMWKEGKRKHIDCWTGRKHNEETKIKIGLANSISNLGERNSQFGTVWIYNLELKVSKAIKKEELEVYIEQGWIKGRKIKFKI